jgi:adenosyl cobinamide kinase/adenosyl cobinamide phosphate guanylyltransferase
MKSLLVLGGARSGKSRYAQGLAAARFQEPPIRDSRDFLSRLR